MVGARYLDVGRGTADVVQPTVSLAHALPTVLRGLRGMRVSGSVELGQALVAAGGRPPRPAHGYAPRPAAVPAEPAGLLPLDCAAADLLAAYDAAFPPGHPD